MLKKVTVYRYEVPDAATGAYIRSQGWAVERAIVERGGRLLKLTAIDVEVDELDAQGHWSPPFVGAQGTKGTR